MKTKSAFHWKLWAGVFLLVILAVGAGLLKTPSSTVVKAEDGSSSFQDSAQTDEEPPSPIAVKVIRPRKGAMERITTQPGSVQAFESVDLFAKVSGFLKTQKVDIGDRVKKDEVLAVVDVPELEKQVERDKAAVEQARSKVSQMKARVTVAQADLEAAKAAVIQAEANAKSAAAWVRFRGLQHQRMKDLFASRSIEEKLVDESKERYEASVETEQAAQAAIATTKAKVTAGAAKIMQAQADVAAAQAEVQVAQADLEKVQVQVAFATIHAPFDGVVTHRGMFPGDFVRAANESGSMPLLNVQRTDLMRVIVQVPDRDVIYADVGDSAIIEIDALPGEKFTAKISRIAQSQDPQTRLMRVEIDLPNTKGKIRNGMYGRVTILLDKATDKLSIPTSCLVSKVQGQGKGSVYVVRKDKAHLVTVRLGEDNGLRVEILEGIGPEDQVILNPGYSLVEGAPVTATYWDETTLKTGTDN